VIIDEFQDTNKLQFELIEQIAKSHKNITVVGDVNQSIYGFRGAYREGFNHFKEIFGVEQREIDGDIFKLDKSYRSPDTVLRTAHKLIKNNYEIPGECLFVENAKGIEGDRIEVIDLKNGYEEARKVAQIVEAEIERGIEPREIGVLYRTHQQGRILLHALEARGIPIISAGRNDLMQRPEIKTAIAYLSVLSNLRERTGTGEQSWWSLFHFRNSLSPSDSLKIGRYLSYLKRYRKSTKSGSSSGSSSGSGSSSISKSISKSILKNKQALISIDDVLLSKLIDLDLSDEGRKIVERVIRELRELLNQSNKSLPDLVLGIYEITGLNRAFTHTPSLENVESLMNLRQFYDISERYYRTHDKSLSSFIEYLEILDMLGVDFQRAGIGNVDAVRVMTMHAVKGLEFKTVIVTNLAEKRFPLERTSKEPLVPKELNPDIKRYLGSVEGFDEMGEKEKNDIIKDYEKKSLLYEERRLCYVSFTRAREKLFMTYARSYNSEEDSSSPSIFLQEIDFRNNKDINVVMDEQEEGSVFAPSSRFEKFKSTLKKQLIECIDSDDFNSMLSRLITYHAVREGKIEDYSKMVDWDKAVDKKVLQEYIKIGADKRSALVFDRAAHKLSPTALLTYDECPKKYELSYIFQMPERGAVKFAQTTGSFVHRVLEKGVKEGFKTKEEFLKIAREFSQNPAYSDVDIEDVNKLIETFWVRHAGRYDNRSLVEGVLSMESGGFKFTGKFDRIDFISDSDVEIIDYKTEKYPVNPRRRAWQLGFYAIAAKRQMNVNPVKLTLEMLRLEKPYEAEVDSEGNARAGRSQGFNINDVEKELVECAKNIERDYESEFLPAKNDEPCRGCGYKFYCPKWES